MELMGLLHPKLFGAYFVEVITHQMSPKETAEGSSLDARAAVNPPSTSPALPSSPLMAGQSLANALPLPLATARGPFGVKRD